ncbi:MAG: hypothetical protein RLZZ236_1605 [Bacteroidota bacterium]|jgi:hypothetical protein
MRKELVAFLFLLVTHSFFAQTVFDQFEGIAGVDVVTINKKMFDLMSKVKLDTSDKETQQYMNLIKKIDHLKVYRTQNERISIQMRLNTEKYAKTAGLEDLISASEGGKKVKILGRQSVDETKLKELLLFVEGNKTDDTVLMTITGDFDLNEVPALTDKMKIPGSAELRKAVKK